MTREVKKVLTAGTLVDEALMNDSRANYILAIRELIDYGARFSITMVAVTLTPNACRSKRR